MSTTAELSTKIHQRGSDASSSVPEVVPNERTGALGRYGEDLAARLLTDSRHGRTGTELALSRR